MSLTLIAVSPSLLQSASPTNEQEETELWNMPVTFTVCAIGGKPYHFNIPQETCMLIYSGSFTFTKNICLFMDKLTCIWHPNVKKRDFL